MPVGARGDRAGAPAPLRSDPTGPLSRKDCPVRRLSLLPHDRRAGRIAGAVLLALALAGPAPGQTAGGSGSDPAAPLARYVPREHVSLYLEFAGLDDRADAWKQ